MLNFNKAHIPAFLAGMEPRGYLCVYPYNRTNEWYLLDPADRGAMLREHGVMGREYPDVLANTVAVFALGDANSCSRSRPMSCTGSLT